MKKTINNKLAKDEWEDFEKEIFTPQEITASNLRAAIISEFIKLRQAKGLSQKSLGQLSGVKQPIIARMEKGNSAPQIDTLLKVLAPLGKTLSIVSLKSA